MNLNRIVLYFVSWLILTPAMAPCALISQSSEIRRPVMHLEPRTSSELSSASALDDDASLIMANNITLVSLKSDVDQNPVPNKTGPGLDASFGDVKSMLSASNGTVDKSSTAVVPEKISTQANFLSQDLRREKMIDQVDSLIDFTEGASLRPVNEKKKEMIAMGGIALGGIWMLVRNRIRCQRQASV